MDNLVEGALAIESALADSALELAWRGRSVAQDPHRALDPYLTRMLERAEAEGRSLRLRLEALEHVNSSTITVLMRFVQDAHSRRVPVEIRFDPERRWQRLTLEALRRVADDGVELTASS